MFGSIAVAVTFPEFGRVQPYLVVDRSSSIQQGDQVSNCPMAPNGTCVKYFPGLAGVSGGAGARIRATEVVGFDVSAGLGSMSGRSEYVGGNITLAMSSHALFVAGVRHIVIHHESGERLWWTPLTVGFRFQSKLGQR